MDFACRGTPIHNIRVALGRLLIEFQQDLSGLETDGLTESECKVVKKFLAKATEIFEKTPQVSSSVPTSVYSEIAKHFAKYAQVYSDWNGHEGREPGKVAARKREVAALSDRRRRLFRKLSQRQAEAARVPQLELFAASLWAPFVELAEFLPERFPRLRQAVQFIGG